MKHLVPKGKSVTAKFYKKVVLKKVQKYFQKQRPKYGLKNVSLLHDNASSHKAQIVTDYLKQENIRVLPHPAYSPDLAPSDYFLFPRLKGVLAGKRYASSNAFCICPMPQTYTYVGLPKVFRIGLNEATV